MSDRDGKIYEFGHYRLNLMEKVLERDGVEVSLTPKAFEVLVSLVENSGHLVGKDELLARIWPDTIVEEGNLSVIICRLRKALGADDQDVTRGSRGNHPLRHINTIEKTAAGSRHIERRGVYDSQDLLDVTGLGGQQPVRRRRPDDEGVYFFG